MSMYWAPVSNLGIDHVGDDGLIFAGKVFVQQFRKPVVGNFVFICGRTLTQPFDSSLELKDRLSVVRRRRRLHGDAPHILGQEQRDNFIPA